MGWAWRGRFHPDRPWADQHETKGIAKKKFGDGLQLALLRGTILLVGNLFLWPLCELPGLLPCEGRRPEPLQAIFGPAPVAGWEVVWTCGFGLHSSNLPSDNLPPKNFLLQSRERYRHDCQHFFPPH